jgi:hypothetical protein
VRVAGEGAKTVSRLALEKIRKLQLEQEEQAGEAEEKVAQAKVGCFCSLLHYLVTVTQWRLPSSLRCLPRC